MRAAASVLCAVALVVAGCGGKGDGQNEERDQAAAAPPETVEKRTRVEVIEQIGEKGGFDPQAVYRRVGPGVVTIISVFPGSAGGGILGGGGGGEGDEEGGGGGDDDERNPPGGLGSGFVVNDRGEIATNAHVVTTGEGKDIKQAKEVYVKFADDNEVPAKIVGYDANADVALLRLQGLAGLTLRPIPLADDRGVEVGEPVVAIGSPFGEEQSLSVGVVSATGRAIESLTGFQTLGAVQTDAAINQGNSGGPLIDARGRVIGINAQIRTQSGGGEGVGYAIPIDRIKRSLDALREDGKVDYAYLGVSTTPVYPQLNDRFKLGTDRGAWVQEIVPGGPAADADIEAGKGQQRFQARPYRPGGDVITEIEGKPIRNENDLGIIVANEPPGTTVTLTIMRDGDRRDVKVKLDERPEEIEP